MAYREFDESLSDQDRTPVWCAFSLLYFYLLLVLMGTQTTKMLIS